MLPLFLFDFNTSNVTIQQNLLIKDKEGRDYFNTSNVTIQHRTSEPI